MTEAVTTPPPPPPPQSRRRGRHVMPTSPEGLPVRRRWGRFAAGAVLALLGGWISATLYMSAGSRVGVLVAASDVGAYETVTRDHLRTVRVAADAGVETISAGDADELVDRVAAINIPEGTLLSPSHFFAEDEQLVSSNEVTLGAELGQGEAPADLTAGTDVLVVIGPGQSDSDGPAQQVDGWIKNVGEADRNGDREVDIVVPRSAAAEVLAASDRLRIAVLEGG
jgi:hypothetical protein